MIDGVVLFSVWFGWVLRDCLVVFGMLGRCVDFLGAFTAACFV